MEMLIAPFQTSSGRWAKHGTELLDQIRPVLPYDPHMHLTLLGPARRQHR